MVDKLERSEVAMDPDYMLACGIVWSKTADPEAGWKLVEALASPDPKLRQFAWEMLLHRRDNAMAILEGAVGTGVLTTEVAGPCIVELLRACRTGSDFPVAGDA
jgi:hypothetical protein